MEKQKILELLLSCVLCKKKFEKINKPLIMFCGHNICEECKIKNFKKVTCSVCKKVFSKREIKKFPINYSMLENKNISQNEVPDNQDNNSDIFSTVPPQVCYDFVSTVINEVYKKMDEIKPIDKKEENNGNDKKEEKNVIDKKEENKKEEEKKKEKDEIDEIVKKRELILKETKEYIDILETNYYEYLNKFFSFIIKSLSSNNEILIKDLNISQLLEETGIINYGDMIKLGKFIEMMEEIPKEDLMNCSSFEQIYSLIIYKDENVKYEDFISLFFFFNKIYELKIKKLPKILEIEKKLYSNKKENRTNLSHFIINFVQKYESNLSDMFYDITTYKSCHFIFNINKDENIRLSLKDFYNTNIKNFEEYKNIMILYEPIEKKLNIHIIKIKELNDEKIIDSYLYLDHSLFILTNKKFYIYQIKQGTYSSLDFLEGQEIEETSKIIKYDISMMVISSNSFQSINLRQDMTKNDWRSISLFENSPGIIKKPYPISHSPSYIYIIDKENNNINEVYVFNPEVDTWNKKEIKLELDSTNNDKNKNNQNKKIEQEEIVIVKKLYLEDYNFFNKCYACIWGGRHPVSKKINKNLYMIDLVKGIMKKIINFDDFITDNMNIIDLNVGILHKYVDFVIIYNLVDDEKNVKIKVIRKEIIENDISLYTKLKILMDINFSEISFNK